MLNHIMKLVNFCRNSKIKCHISSRVCMQDIIEDLIFNQSFPNKINNNICSVLICDGSWCQSNTTSVHIEVYDSRSNEYIANDPIG